MRINKSRFKKRKYVSSNLDSSVYDEFFKNYPQFVENRKEVEALVDGYFEFLKTRLQSFDFLEYTFLNIGTFVSRPKKINNAIFKLEQESQEKANERKRFKSYLYYFVPVTIAKLKNLQKVHEDILRNGKIKRRSTKV